MEPADSATWQAGIDYVAARDGKRFHTGEFTAYVTDRVVAETGQARNAVQAGFARTTLRAKGVIRQVGDGWWEPTGETTTAEEIQQTWEARPKPVAPPPKPTASARSSTSSASTRKKPVPTVTLCPFCHYRHEGGRAECLH